MYKQTTDLEFIRKYLKENQCFYRNKKPFTTRNIERVLTYQGLIQKRGFQDVESRFKQIEFLI